MDIRTRSTALATAVLLLVTLPTAAFAAPKGTNPAGPDVVVLGDQEEADDYWLGFFLPEVCGLDVAGFGVEESGFILEKEHRGRNGNADGRAQLFQAVYRTTVTFTYGDSTLTLRNDVGPDRFYLEDGVVYRLTAGRSLTGTGWIGSSVADAETDELLRTSGRFVGELCDRLAALSPED